MCIFVKTAGTDKIGFTTFSKHTLPGLLSAIPGMLDRKPQPDMIIILHCKAILTDSCKSDGISFTAWGIREGVFWVFFSDRRQHLFPPSASQGLFHTPLQLQTAQKQLTKWKSSTFFISPGQQKSSRSEGIWEALNDHMHRAMGLFQM